MIAIGAGKNKKPISQLADQADSGKLQQRNRIAPVMQLSLAEESHGGGHPTHLVCDAKIRQQFKCWKVCFTHEMVETFNRDAAKVKMCSHPSRFSGGLENIHVASIEQRLIRGRQTHDTGADDHDFRHQTNPCQPEYSLIVKS